MKLETNANICHLFAYIAALPSLYINMQFLHSSQHQVELSSESRISYLIPEQKMLEKMRVFDLESEIEEFEEMTRNACQVQRDTLRKILEQNVESEYLQNLGLDGRNDAESFKACIPIVAYRDIEPYIQRIINDGDISQVLTGKPITALSLR